MTTAPLLLSLVLATVPNAPPAPSAGGTVPAWSTLDSGSGGSSNSSARLASFVATATNHTPGTWSNATKVAAIVVRGQNSTTPIGGHALGGGLGSNDSTAPAVTMSVTDGTSLLLHIHAAGSGVFSPGITDTAPTGYTRQALSNGTGAQGSVCVNTKNDTTSDGSIAQSQSQNTWFTCATIEVRAH